jgi:hypothetical protein
MERITQADIDEMRSSGYDRSTIADAQARLALCQRADELIEQIAAAFAGVMLEDGIGLWESDGIDDYRGADELRALREKDEKIDWRRISADDLNHCNAAPSFLDARGLYFHTPAFMTAELRGEFKQDFIGRLIYNTFTAPEFREMLTAPQRHAIIAYISFYGSIDHYAIDPTDISNAILRYSNPKRDEQ